MKKLLCASLLGAFTGCMNLYTRCPGTDGRIEYTYQCTKEMFSWSLVVAFPQTVAIEGDRGLSWYNLMTVPLSLLVFADDCCESVCDTVCYPFDMTRNSKSN